MATTKLSALTAHTTTDGAEELLINDGGTSKKVTIANLLHDNSIDSDHYVDGSIDLAHMSSESVDEDNLHISNSGSNGEFLSKQSGDAGSLTWAAVSSASTATSSATGLIKIEDDTDQSVAANAVSTTAGRTYGVQLNSSDQAVVNVPWADTNTTYSVTDGELSEINFTSADHTKLNAIEASADVTDATNVTAAGALMDSECAGLAALKLTTGTFLTADQTKLDAIEASADVTDTTNVTAAGALMDSELAGIAAVKATTGTFLSADESKLDAIEAAADVTDATNVAAAGAGMLTVDQAWTGSQRATLVTDNDGSFDMNAGQNFKCTPAGGLALTFTNFANGQSGYIILVNSGGHALTRHADTIADANFLDTVSAAGTYIISYISDGSDAFLTSSAIMA